MLSVAPCPKDLIREARSRLGLTQYDLAEQASVNRWRISVFERGLGVPNNEEQRALCSVLNLPRSRLALAAPSGARPKLGQEKKSFAPRAPYQMPRDRPSEVRFRAALKQYPELIRYLSYKLEERKDSEWISVFLREAVFDSGLEVAASLQLLADGAKPGWLSPQCSGFVQHPIIDPSNRVVTGHHCHPALVWEGCLLFPQLSVRTTRNHFTLDLLVGCRKNRGVVWMDVEFDGPGHDARLDALRADELGMRVERFKTSEIIDGSFLDRLREVTT